MTGEKSKTACWRNADSLLRSERRYRCGMASGKTAACVIPSFPCMKSWGNAINGSLPKWSAGGCSDNWRHRPRNPHVRLCEPLCDLLRGGAASLPRRRISGRFWADFRGLLQLCGGRKQGSRRSPAKRVRWEEETQRNEQVFAVFGGNERYGACGDEKQDKGLASEPTLCPITSARSAGS